MSLFYIILSLGSFGLAALVSTQIKSDIQLTIVTVLIGFAFVFAGQAVIMRQNRRLIHQQSKVSTNKLNFDN